MNSKSLMIGDWVTLNGVDYKWQWTHHDFTVSEFNTLEPIPLTPEILEKNGFDSETFLTTEWEEKVYFKEFPGCVVEPDCSGKYTFGTTCYWDERDVDGSPIDCGTTYKSRIEGLQYVHELQHALRLCGLNDLADNFKI